MNNKGFTLIELLVVLAISALILIMAIPSINSVSNETRNKEFKEYRDSIIYGAKLYYKQKSVDITNNKIYYTDLEKSNYVKSFTATEHNTEKSGNKGCNTDSDTEKKNIYVEISKDSSTNKITYKVVGLKCGNKGKREVIE